MPKVASSNPYSNPQALPVIGPGFRYFAVKESLVSIDMGSVSDNVPSYRSGQAGLLGQSDGSPSCVE